MAAITIDGKEYDLESLSEEARTHLLGVQICDEKVQQLQRELGIVQTARNTYANALRENLPQ